jgi:GDPmannose 4,6-dehydratase
MLQQDIPDDYVIATGVQYSIRDFIKWTSKELGITLAFEGEGVNEKIVVKKIEGDKAPALKIGDVIVQVDERYFRPTEVESLLGDPSKAKKQLGWIPEITAQEMCKEMVNEDLISAQKNALLLKNGYEVNIVLEGK